VSFDTFDKPADFIEENSFTLIAKHKDYEYTKRSRTFLCGCDDNEYSEYALQWLIDELVDDGDEIVCLRVVDKDSTLAADPSVEKGRYRAEAEALMKHIQSRNHENKAINLILEFAMGKVNKVIDEMVSHKPPRFDDESLIPKKINLYEPAILVVGTRGRSLGGFQGLLPGSVSKYCLQHSPVPVIVVRPTYKRDKAKSKREQDPNRHGYQKILEKSGAYGGHIPDFVHAPPIEEADSLAASDDEAAAVASAIGYRESSNHSPLSQVETHTADSSSAAGTGSARGDGDDVSQRDTHSPDVVMKSPSLRGLDSPEMSEISSSDDDDSDDRGGVSTSLSNESAPHAETAGGSSDETKPSAESTGTTIVPEQEVERVGNFDERELSAAAGSSGTATATGKEKSSD